MNGLTECGWLHGAGVIMPAPMTPAMRQAFASAWKKACSLDNTVFLVPAGRRYKVGAIQFVGPCKDNRIIIQVIIGVRCCFSSVQFKDALSSADGLDPCD